MTENHSIWIGEIDKAQTMGLADLLTRLSIRFSPNHTGDLAPRIILEDIYRTPHTGTPMHRSGGHTRAKFWIIFDELETPGVDPYCIMYPMNAYLYGYSVRTGKALWKVSDRGIRRAFQCLLDNFGYRLY